MLSSEEASLRPQKEEQHGVQLLLIPPFCVYGPDMNVRDAPQSLRVTSIGEAKGGPLTGPGQMGLSAYNSVTGNSGSHDISFNVRHGTPYTGIPTYQANNTSSGGQVYTDGSYLFLASDPNP
jgi:hypothetical protein